MPLSSMTWAITSARPDDTSASNAVTASSSSSNDCGSISAIARTPQKALRLSGHIFRSQIADLGLLRLGQIRVIDVDSARLLFRGDRLVHDAESTLQVNDAL